MQERIVNFGPSKGLLGILTEPEPARRKPDAPVIISSNVGLNHRVGPFRLYTDLARRVAAQGYTMLRFDLSGMGDSAPRLDAPDELTSAVLDVQAAMAEVSARLNVHRFVQLGMCSGVDSAHAVSVADPRVVGAIFIEGYTFRTPEFFVRRYVRRLLTPRFWQMYLARKLRDTLGSDDASVREAGAVEEIYARTYPSRDTLRRDYQTLVTRGTELLFVFAGGMAADHAYNYAQQFADTFGAVARNAHVDVQFYAQADHVYSVLSHREQLVQRIEGWLLARFP